MVMIIMWIGNAVLNIGKNALRKPQVGVRVALKCVIQSVAQTAVKHDNNAT